MQLMLANWRSTVSISSTWGTDVSHALSLSEERRTLTDRPIRSMRVLFSGMNQEDTVKLLMNQMRARDARYRVPLYCDMSTVTQASSGTMLWCDTRFKRYFVGGMIVVHEWLRSRPTNVQYRQIAEVHDDRLVLVTALTGTIQVRARVFPTMDAEVDLGGEGTMISDYVSEVDFTAMEVIGSSALPSSCSASPLSMDLYQGYAILDLPSSFETSLDTSIVRAGRAYQQGRGRVVYVTGARPQTEHVLKLIGLDRERSWSIVQFFDSVRGRGRPFWLVTPETLFKLDAISTTFVDVTALGAAADVTAYVSHVAIAMRDGTTYVRAISSVIDNTTTFRLNLGEALPALSAVDVRRVTTARFVRMRDDTMTENWQTDGKCQIELPVTELLEEKDVVISFVEPQTFDAPPLTIPNLWAWFDASYGAFNDVNATAPFTPDRPCEPHPDPASAVDYWMDVRGLATPYAVSSTAIGHRLISFPDGIQGGSRRVFEHAHVSLDSWTINNNGLTPWDNAQGLTIFIVARLTSTPATVPELLRISNGANETMLWWKPTVVQLYEAANVTNTNLWIQDIVTPFDGDMHVMILRWSPGVAAQLYYDGILQGASDVSPAYMPTDVVDTQTMMKFSNTGDADQATVLRSSGVPRHCFDAAAAYFSRALSDSELNEMGQYLATLYGTVWTSV